MEPFNKARFLRRAAGALEQLDTSYRERPTSTAESFAPWYETAAVVSSFDVNELRSVYPTASEDDINELMSHSSPIKAPDGTLRWTLDPHHRSRVIQQLGSANHIQRALENVSQRPTDLVQQMMDAYVEGSAPGVADQTLVQLTASHRIVPWLHGLIPSTPTLDEVNQQIDSLSFLQQFKDLVGENFQGRKKELAKLRDYVGVLDASSFLEAVSRGVRHIFSFHEKPPLMIHGPGGMGKSTLIAKFIMEHALVADNRKFPVVYIDFDRPAMAADEPVSLLMEALRQLSVQIPETRESLLSLREAWEEQFIDESRKNLEATTQTRSMPSQPAQSSVPRASPRMRERMLDEFASTLRVLESTEKPLLFVLDTFEQVQVRGQVVIDQLWKFLEQLQERHPRLRVVISGRVPIVSEVMPTENYELRGVDRKASQKYLQACEMPARWAKVIAKYVAPRKQGAHPLSLRVAVGVWEKRQALDVSTPKEVDEHFWSQLRSGRIQVQLISRYLDHICDESLKELAYLGFVLRRLSAELIQEVLSEPSGVEVKDKDHAKQLLDALRNEISIVTSVIGDDDELQPRTEVRWLVLDLLKDLEPEKVERVHTNAVTFYERKSDNSAAGSDGQLANRAEELYHRLALKQDEDRIRARWLDGVAGRLAGASEELESYILDGLMGKSVSEEQSTRASQEIWEHNTARTVEDLLRFGEIQKALSLLNERQERTPLSPLYLLQAEALFLLGRWPDARHTLQEAIGSFTAGSSSSRLIDCLCHAAEADLRLHDPAKALQRLDKALELAEDREDKQRLLGIRLLQLRAVTDESSADEAQLAAIRTATSRLVGRMSDAELWARPDSMIQTAAALGSDFPDVLIRTVRLGGLEGMRHVDARKLGRAMGQLDAQISRRAGEEPGMVALKAGIPFKGSATDAWKVFFFDGHTFVPEVIPKVLETYEVPPGHEVLRVITEAFRAQTDSTRDDEAEPESAEQYPKEARRHVDVERRKMLHEALSSAFNVHELGELTRFRLDRNLESLTNINSPPTAIVFSLITTSQREGWIDDLIVVALEARPGNPQLMKVADEFGLSTVPYSAPNTDSFIHDEYLHQLGRTEVCVCRVEIAASGGGTGFLVSPDLLLTAYSVLESVIRGKVTPDDFVCRFDYKEDAQGKQLRAGTPFGLAKDWLVDYSPYAPPADGPPPPDALDYALLRLDGYPGDEPIGGMGARRGWIEVPRDVPQIKSAETIMMLHHPLLKPMELVVGNVVSISPTEFTSTISSAPGSAGAPCFNTSWELLAMHHAVSATSRGIGIPIAAILRLLEARGVRHLLGVELE